MTEKEVFIRERLVMLGSRWECKVHSWGWGKGKGWVDVVPKDLDCVRNEGQKESEDLRRIPAGWGKKRHCVQRRVDTIFQRREGSLVMLHGGYM